MRIAVGVATIGAAPITAGLSFEEEEAVVAVVIPVCFMPPLLACCWLFPAAVVEKEGLLICLFFC